MVQLLLNVKTHFTLAQQSYAGGTFEIFAGIEINTGCVLEKGRHTINNALIINTFPNQSGNTFI